MITRSCGALLAVVLLESACGQPRAMLDAKFGDQNFKTSIALIELYKTRHGTYPTSLGELDFVGDWDQIALSAVSYRRLSDGYSLNVVRGWVGKPSLQYPPAFWHGLGLRESNVRSN